MESETDRLPFIIAFCFLLSAVVALWAFSMLRFRIELIRRTKRNLRKQKEPDWII